MKKYLCLVLVLCLAGSASAAFTTWTGATSTDVTVGTNWSAGTPTSGDVGILNGTVTNMPDVTSGKTLTTGVMWHGYATAGDFELTVSGGTVDCIGTGGLSGWYNFGVTAGAHGTLTVSGDGQVRPHHVPRPGAVL